MEINGNVTKSNEKLSLIEMVNELPIKKEQLRRYIKDGRLKAEKIRNKFYSTRKDFNEFKIALNF